MIGSENLKVTRIVGKDESPAEANRGGDHQSVDRLLTVTPGGSQKVAGDPGDPHSGRHHTGETPPQDVVDRLVRSRAPVELDENGRRHAHRLASPLGASHRSPYPLVPLVGIPGTRERGQRLAVEDQDGQSAS